MSLGGIINGWKGSSCYRSGLYILSRKGYQFLESFEALEGHRYLFLDTGQAFWGGITIRLPYSYTLP